MDFIEVSKSLFSIWGCAWWRAIFSACKALSRRNTGGISRGSNVAGRKKGRHPRVFTDAKQALRVDAIVNAANSGMLGCFVANHACIDNAIHTFAGVQLRMACAAIMEKQKHPEPTGRAKITEAYNLPSKYILHTVGPIITGALTQNDCEQLASCYRSCLELAEQNGVRSIAFCCISTGEFRFPNERAAEIAIKTVSDYITASHSKVKVVFNVFKEKDYDIYRRLLG